MFPQQPWTSPVSGVVGFSAQICKNITKPCKSHIELARLTHTHPKWLNKCIVLWCCPSSGTDCTLFCLTLAEVKKQRLRNISVFSYVCLLSTCDTIRTATNYLVDVFCRKYQSRVSVIKELALKWSCELWNLSFSMVYWDWLSQEAGTGPGCFHVATRILKVMESLTAVGRRIPCLLLTLGFSSCTPHSLSPLGRCCRDRWPLSSWAANEAHPFFLFFFFFWTHHLLFQQHQYCLCHTSGQAARRLLCLGGNILTWPHSCKTHAFLLAVRTV